MLGPLPKVYRFLVSAAAVAVFIALGAWAATMLSDPTVPLVGAGIGAGLGLVAVYLIVHDSHVDDRVRPHRAVARHHRHR